MMSGMLTARRLRRLPVLTLVAGLAVFIGLSIACGSLFDQSEDRLLRQRGAEAGLVIAARVGDARAPLASAAELANATDGDPATFEAAMGKVVGDGKPYSSATLYPVGEVTPIATVGVAPALAADGGKRANDMLTAVATDPFVIVDLLGSGKRRLGYAVTDSGSPARYVVYAERTLADNPNVRRRTEQPFVGLDYAIYLGRTADDAYLLGSSLQQLPITGRQASVDVPFGNTQLLLVVTPESDLGGALFARLWWIVLVVGGVISVLFAGLVQRLLARRDTAVALAADNARLYDDQREIAETLQISLLPQHLDAPRGTEVAARYWPAGTVSLIGGDFYDVFRVDDTRWGVTIGDVCGKGIEAAALTGLARHTIRAAARHGNSASEVLRAVHTALSDQIPPTFCTACFLYVRPDGATGHTITISLGGHPQPILRHRDGSVTMLGTAGTLLGMIEPELHDATVSVGPGDLLLLYTDGLTDAPGEQAVPIEEVIDLLAMDGHDSVEHLADEIRVLKRTRRPSGSADDTALLVIRFTAEESETGSGFHSGSTGRVLTRLDTSDRRNVWEPDLRMVTAATPPPPESTDAGPDTPGSTDELHLSTVAPTGPAESHVFHVVARGEIDLASAPVLTARLDQLIDDGATVIVLNASGVSFLDSTGLRSIIGASNRLSDIGGQLLIEGMSGAVRAVLEISGLLERYRATTAHTTDA